MNPQLWNMEERNLRTQVEQPVLMLWKGKSIFKLFVSAQMQRSSVSLSKFLDPWEIENNVKIHAAPQNIPRAKEQNEQSQRHPELTQESVIKFQEQKRQSSTGRVGAWASGITGSPERRPFPAISRFWPRMRKWPWTERCWENSLSAHRTHWDLHPQ